MSKIWYDLVISVMVVFLDIPLPWRPLLIIGFFLFLAVIVGNLLKHIMLSVAETGSKLLKYGVVGWVYPEYVLTRFYRSRATPLPTWYLGWSELGIAVVRFYDAVFGWVKDKSENLYFQKRWVAFVLLLLMGGWYGRPYLNGLPIVVYLDQGLAWYLKTEQSFIMQIANSSPSFPASNRVIPLTITPSPTRARPTVAAQATVIPSATPEPLITPTTINLYVVQQGDSLHKIADRFGISVDSIVEANAISYPSLTTDPTRISVGWQLVIPDTP
jgi:hypothetical protein